MSQAAFLSLWRFVPNSEECESLFQSVEGLV